MENYNVRVYDQETFESQDIETKIPKVLIESVKSCLDNLDEIVATPIVVNPDDLSLSVGILVKDEKSHHHLKYRVSISVIESGL
jgi:hypothetical protein